MEELGERMGSWEFTYWKEYVKLRPIGEAAADLRTGIICSTLWQAIRGTYRKPIEFMPIVRALENVPTGPVIKTPEEQETLKAKFAAVAARLAQRGKKPGNSQRKK